MEKPRKYYLEIRKQGGTYSGLIRTSFRVNGKVTHTNHGMLTHMTLQDLKVVRSSSRYGRSTIKRITGSDAMSSSACSPTTSSGT